MLDEDALRTLREAVQLSPDNIPLRLHLAATLLKLSRPAEAEQEYREALTVAPGDARLKIGLARAFQRQGKGAPALVIVEDLLKDGDAPSGTYVMHARLLLQAGEVARAVLQYERALALDPASADPELGEALGLPGEAQAPEQRRQSPVVGGRQRLAWGDAAAAPDQPPERPSLTFADVGGMEALKEEIRLKIIYPLTHADLYRAYGKPIGGGILLYGPPGCGKTYLARATAGEIEAAFIAVGINDVLDMWVGNSERNLHDLFEQARRQRPCVLFFDEVDALGASRSDMRHSAARHLINQFLSELDGVQTSNEGVLVLAATNAPWHLDAAFRRPGRFDRVLFVPPPDAEARQAILRLLCHGKPVGEIDFALLARKTEHCSGADLKAVVDLAVERKLQQALKEGLPKPLTTKDLLGATESARPSTRDWFGTARNYALYSNQSGAYDDILKYLKLT
ncbi:MAG: ATP-binding protein [Chloroflexota bacterium]